MVLLAAALAGFFSVAGGYFVAGFQARHGIVQKKRDYRVEAYRVFLDKTGRDKAPSLSQLLNVGMLADHLATDWEIQSFENKIAAFLKRHDTQDLCEIDWTAYSPEVAAFHDEWKMSQEKGVVYGLEERVSGEERLMIVTIAKLTQVLVWQLRLEIQGASA